MVKVVVGDENQIGFFGDGTKFVGVNRHDDAIAFQKEGVMFKPNDFHAFNCHRHRPSPPNQNPRYSPSILASTCSKRLPSNLWLVRERL